MEFLFSKRIRLFIWNRYRKGRGRDTGKMISCLLLHFSNVLSGLGWGRPKPEWVTCLESPTWVTWHQNLGLSSATFPTWLEENWIGNWIVETWTGAHRWCRCHRKQRYIATPLFFVFTWTIRKYLCCVLDSYPRCLETGFSHFLLLIVLLCWSYSSFARVKKKKKKQVLSYIQLVFQVRSY